MSRQNSKQIENVKVMLLKGESGSSIESIEKTGTQGLVDTYTITLTDGSKETFTVTNGDSIASIEKTGTSGLVDTYTITMTDGSTSTFTVTNATGTIDTDFSASSTNPIENKSITNIIAGVENGNTASKTYYKNDLILRGDSLFEVQNTVASGGTWIEGTNIIETTLGELLSKQTSALSHIGMIIHSTTLDTEAKVIAIYGGTQWTKIEGMFLLGADSTYTIGSTGGEATHKLTTSEIPAHNHGLPNAGALSYTMTGGGNDIGSSTFRMARDGYQFTATKNAGGGGSHNNMPPYKAVYIWERTA